MIDSIQTWFKTNKQIKEETHFCSLSTLFLAYAYISIQDTTDENPLVHQYSKFIISVLNGKSTESDQISIVIPVTSFHKTLLIAEYVTGATSRSIFLNQLLIQPLKPTSERLRHIR